MAALSFLAACPRLYLGTNIVTEVYRQATAALWQGVSPYSVPLPDLFVYSPAFAIAYTPFAVLPASVQALLWGLANVVGYWWGIALWVPKPRDLRPLEKFGLVAAAIELNGCLLYQQVNALLVGLVLIGLARYRDNRKLAAGIWLAFSIAIKPIAGFAILPFAIRIERKFWLGLIIGGTIVMLLPFALGLSYGWQLDADWLQRIFFRVGQDRGQLDLGGTFRRAGLGNLGAGLALAIALASLAALAQPWRDGAARTAFVLAATMLTLPTAESPSFAIAAPAYFLLASSLVEGSRAGSAARIGRALLFVAVFTTTLAFTDLWPRRRFPLSGSWKMFGVFAVWVAAFCRRASWGTIRTEVRHETA